MPDETYRVDPLVVASLMGHIAEVLGPLADTASVPVIELSVAMVQCASVSLLRRMPRSQVELVLRTCLDTSERHLALAKTTH